MCIKCDQAQSETHQLDQDELFEHHMDIMMEITYLSKNIVDSQRRVAELSDRLEEVDNEIELREAKETSSLN